MGAKYELVKDEKDAIVVRGCELYRIRALKDFSNVKKGDLGGYVSSVYNLDQAGDCWIYDDAKVFQNAKVYGNAIVCGSAEVSGNALVYDNAIVGGFARVYEHARVIGASLVIDNVQIFQNATVIDVAMYDNYVASGGYYNEEPVYSDMFSVTLIEELVENTKESIMQSDVWRQWRDNESYMIEHGDYGYEWQYAHLMNISNMCDWWNYKNLFDDQINFCLSLKGVFKEYLLMYEDRDNDRRRYIANAIPIPAEDATSHYLKKIYITLTGNDVNVKSEEYILGVDRKIEELKIQKKNLEKQKALENQKRIENTKRKKDKPNELKTQKEKSNKQEVKRNKKTENQDVNSLKKAESSGIFQGFVTRITRKRKKDR